MSELTAGEKAYMESGGQDASALLAENPATPAPAIPETAPAPAALPVPAPDAAAPATPAADPIELGEEEIPDATGKAKRRVVDSRALKEERNRRKALEDELKSEREMRARVDERLKLLTDVVSQPETPPPPAAAEAPEAPIDPEQDIFGAYKQQQKRLEQLTATLESLQSGQAEMRQQTAEERQTAAMVSTYRQDAAAFGQKQPDFTQAYNFLLAKRGAQLKALGYGDDEVRTSLYNEEMNLAQRALAMRQSPSAQIYALAESMGYQRAAAPAASAPAAPAAVPSAPAAAPTPAASVTAEIDRIRAGQASSRSLSTGGGAAGEEMSLEALSNMPMPEFARFMAIPGNRERVEAALGKRAA